MENFDKKVNHALDVLNRTAKDVLGGTIWWWRWLGAVTTLAVVTRLIGLHEAPGTVWDEVHFGKFANNYINRTFFHDVHPPLGKMVVAGILKLVGYNLTFSFDASSLYPTDFNYVAARAVFGMFGASFIPLTYLTVYYLTASIPASVLASVALLSDHFIHRISTLILLDSPLIFTILASVCSSFAFSNKKHRPFSWPWWGQLCVTGMCLGLVMSIKYIGVFTVVFVGLHTAYQLFEILFSPKHPMVSVVPHTVARVLCLIVLPCFIYLITFVVHFAVLDSWRPHDGGFHHRRFIASFKNTEYENKFFPKYIEYGANISLRNSMAMSGTLESWFDLFPSQFTAPCQQVSLSGVYDDESLAWTLRYVNITGGSIEDDYKLSVKGKPRRVLHTGDFVVFTHQASERSLRAHGHKAPVTKRQYQVCGYGDNGTAGPFETWEVSSPGVAVGVPVDIMNMELMFKNFQMNCYLANPGNVPLPADWAYLSAKEVTCNKNEMAEGLKWHIGWVHQTKLPLTQSAKTSSMSLWEKIVFQHEAMILGNRALKPKDDKGEGSATPWMWPVMYRMQMLCSYAFDEVDEFRNGSASTGASNTTSKDAVNSNINESPTNAEKKRGLVTLTFVGGKRSNDGSGDDLESEQSEPGKHYLGLFFHNPVVAYVNILALVASVLLALYHLYTMIRGSNLQTSPTYVSRQRTVTASLWLLTCWGIHYLPFFCMSRILYMHHYCPSYCYSCMIAGVILSHFSQVLAEYCGPRLRYFMQVLLMGSFITILLWSYYLLFPFATVLKSNPGSIARGLHPVLKRLHLGQAWHEVGFESDYIMEGQLVTELTSYDSHNFNNPDVNVKLYYNSSVSPLELNPELIRPVASSNYSHWTMERTQRANNNDSSTSVGEGGVEGEGRAPQSGHQPTGDRRAQEEL